MENCEICLLHLQLAELQKQNSWPFENGVTCHLNSTNWPIESCLFSGGFHKRVVVALFVFTFIPTECQPKFRWKSNSRDIRNWSQPVIPLAINHANRKLFPFRHKFVSFFGCQRAYSFFEMGTGYLRMLVKSTKLARFKSVCPLSGWNQQGTGHETSIRMAVIMILITRIFVWLLYCISNYTTYLLRYSLLLNATSCTNVIKQLFSLLLGGMFKVIIIQ